MCLPVHETLEAGGGWPPLDRPLSHDLIVGAGKLSHRVLVDIRLCAEEGGGGGGGSKYRRI